MFVPEKVAGELAFLDRFGTAGFERPYGWAWLLALHGEAARHDAGWAGALAPLAAAFAARFHAHLPKLTYPIRVGTHFNTSFALVLARDWAAAHDPALVALIDERASAWFLRDRGCQAWEPGGDEFLSPALSEALLMSRVLAAAEISAPGSTPSCPISLRGEPAALVHPGERSRTGQRRQDRAPRRAQPQSRLVLARTGGRASVRSPAIAEAAASAPPRRFPPASVATIIWASIGSRPSPCWRSPRHRPETRRMWAIRRVGGQARSGGIEPRDSPRRRR